MMRSLAVFAAWTVVGFFCSFGLLYGFTPFVLPLLAVAWAAFRFLPILGESRMPESLGAAAGLGVFGIFLSTSVDSGASTFDLIGIVMLAAASLSFLAIARRRSESGLSAG